MSPSNSRKVTIRLTCSRKLHDIPKEILYMICDGLPNGCLQQLSLANKSLRTTVTSLCNEVELPRVNVRRLEIEKKISKVLVINITDLNYDVFREVLQQCNIYKVKVLANLTRNQVNYLTMIMKDFDRVKQVFTQENQTALWNIVKRIKKANFAVVPLDAGLPERIIQTVNPTHVPGISVEIQAFNIFRKAAMLKLQRNRKLDNLEEALSLNYIMLASHPKLYNLERSERPIDIIDSKDVVTHQDKASAKKIVEEVVKVVKAGSINFKKSMKKLHAEYANASDFVERCLTMFDNLSKKISPTWNMSKMTEDTLAIMILDPIMSAFLDNTIDNMEYHGADYELPESRKRKLVQAAKNNQPTKDVRGRRPDRSASVNKRHVFLAELKTAKNAKNRSDLVKIGTMMKDVVDVSLKSGYPREEISVVGLLVEGENCSVYLMQSPSQAFAIYQMYQVSHFKLPKDQGDLKVLVDTAISLEICRALVIQAAAQANNNPQEWLSQDVRWNSFSPSHHAEYYS